MTPGLLKHRLNDPEVRRVLRGLLADPRYEVLPLEGVVDDVVDHLPEGATVTITASPARGPEATLTVAEALTERGFRAVPHLSARQLDQALAASALDRLRAAGVEEVFIVGGDDAGAASKRITGASAAGGSAGFSSGEALVAAVHEASPELSISVPGYPEGHPAIPDEVLEATLQRKLGQADRVVGQLCFDGGTVRSWAERVQRSATVQVYAGVPGAVGSARLLRIAAQIGVGDSLRFLKGGGAGVVRRLASPGRHDSSQLVTDLVGAGGGVVLSGLHLYTFNALEQTEQWRRRLLARLQEEDAL